MTGADTDAWGRLGSPISQDWGEGVGLFANPSSQAPQPPKPSKGSAGVNISLGDLNPHFVCVLCFGYFVDATTITECLHTFCRSCIVSFLKDHRHCPHCDTLLLKTRPFSSLRSDRVLQALVYKTVPGLFQTEMRRRIRFYQNTPEAVGTPAYQRDVEEFQQFVFSPDDSVSLVIRHYNSRRRSSSGSAGPNGRALGDVPNGTVSEDDVGMSSPDDVKSTGPCSPAAGEGGEDDMVRYFRCPATVPVYVLKQLVKSKHRVPDPLRVELLHGEDRLLDAWTLMEIAYIYTWTRESPLELSFQVVATRRVKKRRHPHQPVLNHGSRGLSVGPPSQPSSSDCDDLHEPPEKIAKMENSNIESERERRSSFREHSDSSRGSHHMTPLSPDDPHGRPPTPPETPESQQHHQMHHEAKCEESSSSEEPGDYEAPFGSSSTRAESCDGDEDETLMGDQDSEAPLEVDTSHETEPELEIETDDTNQKDEEDLYSERVSSASRADFERTNDEQQNTADDSNASTDHEFMANVSENDETVDVKPPRRIRRNVVVQAGGQDGSCAFSDSEVDETMDEVGALDLSDHARSVREARARGSLDLSRGQGTQTMLSITQSRTSKKKNRNNTTSPSRSNWNSNQTPHAARFHDLFTLSQAAVIQLALAQARAQEEAKKSMQASKLGKLRETADSLSFVNGSGDTLTISAINSSDSNSKSDPAAPYVKTHGGKASGGPSQKLSNEENRSVTNTITISRAGKHGTLKSKLNKSPTHRSSGSSDPLRVASVSSSSSDKTTESVSKESGRTSDPIFKITNQKLSECFRQQMSNKLKLNSNSKYSGNKSTCSDATSPILPPSSSSPLFPARGNASQVTEGSSCNDIMTSSASVSSSNSLPNGVSVSGASLQTTARTSLPNTKLSIPPASVNSNNNGAPTFLKANSSVSISTSSVPCSSAKVSSSSGSSSALKNNSSSANNSFAPKSSSSVGCSIAPKISSLANSVDQKSNYDKDSKTHELNSVVSCSTKPTLSQGPCSIKQSTTTNPASPPSRLDPHAKLAQAFSSTKSGQMINNVKTSTVSNLAKPSQVINSTKPGIPLISGFSKSSLVSSPNKPPSISITKSTLNNGNGITQTKSIFNGNKSSCLSSKASVNGVGSLADVFNKSISSSISSLLSSPHGASLTAALRTSSGLTPAVNITSGVKTTSPYRSLLNGVVTSTTSACAPQRTSTTNSAPVRATNSSVRQIPNPSLLHQQSESRLTGSSGRLSGVLNRLSSNGVPSAGISRIESLTRSLHEKAAGAAAAAINTAAR